MKTLSILFSTNGLRDGPPTVCSPKWSHDQVNQIFLQAGPGVQKKKLNEKFKNEFNYPGLKTCNSVYLTHFLHEREITKAQLVRYRCKHFIEFVPGDVYVLVPNGAEQNKDTGCQGFSGNKNKP